MTDKVAISLAEQGDPRCLHDLLLIVLRQRALLVAAALEILRLETEHPPTIHKQAFQIREWSKQEAQRVAELRSQERHENEPERYAPRR